MRTRVLRPRWSVIALIVWGAGWLALPAPVDAALLPSAGGGLEGASRALWRVLEDQGLSRADAEAVLARLTPAERAELAARVDELTAGGENAELIYIIAVVVAILLEVLRRVRGHGESGYAGWAPHLVRGREAAEPDARRERAVARFDKAQAFAAEAELAQGR